MLCNYTRSKISLEADGMEAHVLLVFDTLASSHNSRAQENVAGLSAHVKPPSFGAAVGVVRVVLRFPFDVSLRRPLPFLCPIC